MTLKKQVAILTVSYLLFFALIILFRGWFSTPTIAFLLGGLIGIFLPDIDHFIYVYLLRPHELTSQRVVRLISKRQVLDTFRLLTSTRNERKSLIFHSALFQMFFYAFAFFVITSSNSLFGRGIVLAFLLHLLIDQYIDFKQLGTIEHWFRNIKVSLNKERSTAYWALAAVTLVIFGLLF